MNDILKEVETLKKMILDSKEYKDFILYRDNLDSNKQINKIISKIKNVQKILINKQDKNEDTTEEEIKFKIGEVTDEDIKVFTDTYNKYLENK